MNKNYGPDYYSKTSDANFEIARIKMEKLAIALSTNFHSRVSVDIGCARGLLVQSLRYNKVEAFGLDVSDYIVSIASDMVKPYLKVVDIERSRWPFQDASLDLVTALETVEHLNNIEYTISEVHRVLKQGGYFYITTPLPIIDNKFGQFLLGKGWHRLDKTHVNVHWRYYWKRLLNESGFCYVGTFQNALCDTPSEFWPIKLLANFRCGNAIRAYISGTYLFIKR